MEQEKAKNDKIDQYQAGKDLWKMLILHR